MWTNAAHASKGDIMHWYDEPKGRHARQDSGTACRGRLDWYG